MAALDDILAQIPVADIASRVGIDEGTAAAAIGQILPSIVGGMKANADSGDVGLAGALASHGKAGHAAPADIDEEDGAKIIGHIFGDRKDAVAAQLADSTPNQLVSSGTIMKLLPILAPIVLSLIGKKIFGGGDDEAAAPKKKTTSKKKTTKVNPPADEAGGLGGLGDLLGGILGGGASSSSSSSGGGFLGGILSKLGGLFGGGK